MANKVPPYFHNKDDDSCQQAVIRMMVEYFEPEKKWDWDTIDKVCEYEEGKATWDTFGHYNLAKLGYEVVVYDSFDLKRFAADTKNYLNEQFGESFAKLAYEISNVDLAVEYANKVLKDSTLDLTYIYKSAELEDMKRLLSEGYLLNVWVNNNKLMWHIDEDNGHFTLVYKIDDEHVYLHNPGGIRPEDDPKTSRIQSQKVDIDHFLYATTLNNKRGGVTGVKLGKN